MSNETNFEKIPYSQLSRSEISYSDQSMPVADCNNHPELVTNREKLAVCTANKKDRRKCHIVTPSYETCHECPLCGIKKEDINLGDPNKRGGIESSNDSYEWRKHKWRYGIPHGDN